MDLWSQLGRIVLLLGVAAGMGLLVRRLGQNVLVGYLLAGVLLGPSGLNLFADPEQLRQVSEIGVALLLFSIGLEFSFARLRSIGRVATLGGALQIAGTSAVLASMLVLAGLPPRESLVISFALAMSSTAVVLRVLTDRAELDSSHGRVALGFLLMQDLAVVPLLVVTQALGTASEGFQASGVWLIRLGAAFAIGGLLWVLLRFGAPRLFAGAILSGSRDLPVLVAVCGALGVAWITHSLGLPPSLGAFLAGMLLAESPLAVQIRADLTPLTAAFVTTFFTSIGALVRLPAAGAVGGVLAAAVGLSLLKAVLVAAIVWSFQRSLRTAVRTGIALSQVGEFTFVLADIAYQQVIITGERFQFLVAMSLVTLVMTPYAIAAAPRVSSWMLRRIPHRSRRAVEAPQAAAGRWNRVIIVGFGPAGRQIAEALRRHRVPFLVLDMNPETVAAFRSELPIELGDATQQEILQHVGVGQSAAVAVTIPDPVTAQVVVAQAGRLARHAPIVVRARYHRYASQFDADRVATVDEEQLVGAEMARELLCRLKGDIMAPHSSGGGS